MDFELYPTITLRPRSFNEHLALSAFSEKGAAVMNEALMGKAVPRS